VFSLTFPGELSVDQQTQTDFLTTLADACALALERAITSRHAQSSADKLAFLAEASAELSASLDYRTTLTRIARLVVPRMADWCAVHVVEDGAVTTLTVVHADPAKADVADELRRRYRPDLNAPSGAGAVVRTGRSELYPVVTAATLRGGRDIEALRMIHDLGLSSMLSVPLTGRTGCVGALSLAYARSGRRYNADDLTIAEDLGRRAALAVETAHAFHEQSGWLAAVSRVAEAAQRAILAPVPGRVGPVTLSARYLSAAAEARVGGDLYEVVRMPGAVRLIVGDVRGKGLEAVRMATVVLGEFRAAAVEPHSLVEVATRIDARLRSHLDEEDFVTGILAEISDDGALTVACCGHPPALLAEDGQITEIDCFGSPPFGLGAAPSLVTARLAPGARLLLYTDGIVDARDPQRRFVDFEPLVAPLAHGDHETVLDRILATVHAAVGAELGDDLALLLAEYQPDR
jgi:serine phosphatase RsbU (regulator of sigma subunit)